MYRSLRIRGFRGISECLVTDLAPVNLLTGFNGAGKTTILEALHIHSRPLEPNVIVELDNLRAGTPSSRGGDDLAPRSLPWDQLFGKGSGSPGEFEIDGQFGKQTWGISAESTGVTSDVTANPEEAALPLGQSSGFAVPVGQLELSCLYNGRNYVRWVTALSNGALSIFGARRSSLPLPEINVLRTTPQQRDAQKNAEQFSALQGTEAEAAVLQAAQIVDKRIRRLVVSTSGSATSLRADLGGGRLLDLPLISDGLTRVVSMMVNLAQCRDGVFLIDEFENGIYFGALERTWSTLHEVARSLNVQILATTHSMECIEAASRAIKRGLNVYRVDRENGSVKMHRFDAARTSAALEQNIDLR